MERPQSAELDRDAFEHLVAENQDAIYRLVYRLLGWQDGADDVVQDVFLAAWAAWRRHQGPDAAFWLKRIAVNKCRSRMRRDAVRSRWMSWMRLRVPDGGSHETAENRLVAEERDSRVRRAIQSLDIPCREVTVLCYLEQMSIDAIAELTRQRRNTVEVRLHRARKKLEVILADLME
jgi:RNA polymerase sigma factor (sigma-70 family)